MIQSSRFYTRVVGVMACYKNFKFHVIGVHVNALRFGVAKIWKSSVHKHLAYKTCYVHTFTKICGWL